MQEETKKRKVVCIILSILIIVAIVVVTINNINKTKNTQKVDYPVSTVSEIEIASDYTKNKKINSDYIGTLKFQNGIIEEAVVQGEDNDEYLRTNWRTGEYDEEGSIFMDSENKLTDQTVKKTDKEKILKLQKTALDHRHPNCVVFDISGQLYIGDSLGHLHIWEFKIDRGYPLINKLRVLTHKEIELDTINKINLVPNQPKKLLIHSRDNCIRLIDISTEKTKVILRYFGLKCYKTNIKSTVSPDGAYIMSGSETGTPYIWQLETGIPYSTN